VSAALQIALTLTLTVCVGAGIVAALLGYTAWDTLPLLYYRNEWSGIGMYIIHHTATLLGWGTAAITGMGHNIAIPVQLFEFTAPFTNLRWALHAAGLKGTTLYLVNGIAMFVSFFALRVVFNIWLFGVRFIWQYEAYSQLPTWIQLDGFVVYCANLALQLLWFSKILKGVIALFQSKSSTPSRGQSPEPLLESKDDSKDDISKA